MIAAPPAAPPPLPEQALVTLLPGASPRTLGSGATRLYAGSATWIVRLTPGASIEDLRRHPGVRAVEPDRVRTRLGGPDPLAVGQGHLGQIGWTPPRGPRRPLVAVLDTGVDGTSRDLRGRIAPGARSFVDNEPLVDRSGHGTHVAGLIAAAAGNGVGVAGVANARLLIVKIADAHGRATTATLVRGIRYAVAHRARIINVSFGGSDYSRLEQEAILDARRAGILVVVAAGNTGRFGNSREYPGAYRHVLTVAASRPDGAAILDSTRGPQVAIAAPGKRVLSLEPRGRYGRRTGTSMATAIVTGAAARLLAQRPGLQVSQVWSLLLGTARDTGPPGRDDATGWGGLDLAGALAAPTPSLDRPEPNDDPELARRTPPVLPGGAPGETAFRATLDAWSDPKDGYRVDLAAGETLRVEVSGAEGSDLDLVVWNPGAPRFSPGAAYAARWLAAAALGPGTSETLTFTAEKTGTHTLEVRAAAGRGRYTIAVRRAAASTALRARR